MPRHTKWKNFGSSIFSVMTAASNTAQAVNLAQGFPDFDGPDQMKEAAVEAIRKGPNQYAPAAGILQLRELASSRRQHTNGIRYCPETEVTVCTGATEGLFSTLQAICEIGDEVIIFAPFYDSYPAGIHAAGAIPREVKLNAPDWTFDEDALTKAISNKTKAIIVNSPHNPTGRVFSKAELQQIADVCIKNDLIAITDEVYDEIWFGADRPASLASIPGMRDRTIVITSAAKTYSFTGWKVGFVFASPELTKAFRAVHQFTVFCTAAPLQMGVLCGLQLPESFYIDLRNFYRSRRDELTAILKSQGFNFIAPEGSYFILADYAAISNKNDLDFAHWLTNQSKVAAVPISPFYLDTDNAAASVKYVRFAFCKKSETLQAAAENFRTCFSC